MKVPVHKYDKTVTFYRDILSFEEVDSQSPDGLERIAFKFGNIHL